MYREEQAEPEVTRSFADINSGISGSVLMSLKDELVLSPYADTRFNGNVDLKSSTPIFVLPLHEFDAELMAPRYYGVIQFGTWQVGVQTQQAERRQLRVDKNVREIVEHVSDLMVRKLKRLMKHQEY